MYEKIYDFCKVRNKGNIFSNDESPTPRVKFLMNLLNSENITYELDKFFTEKVTGYNIILKGTSNRMVVAHHDVNNHKIDNANDNSCSVINAIMVKKLMPTMNVVLLGGIIEYIEYISNKKQGVRCTPPRKSPVLPQHCEIPQSRARLGLLRGIEESVDN